MELRQRRFCGGEFFSHLVQLLAAEEPPLSIFHIAGRNHSDQTSVQAAKNDKSQPAIQSFTERYITPLTSSPDLVVSGKDFFDLFGSKLMALDMKDVVLVPVEPRNDLKVSVA
jgi:hypothetical protein